MISTDQRYFLHHITCSAYKPKEGGSGDIQSGGVCLPKSSFWLMKPGCSEDG